MYGHFFPQEENSNNVLLRILNIHIGSLTYYTKFNGFVTNFHYYVIEIHKLYKSTWGLGIKISLLHLKGCMSIENGGDSEW